MSDSPSKPDLIPQGTTTIRLECAGVGAPLIVRVRRLLKSALRAHGLRAVKVELPPDEVDGGEHGH